MGLGKCTPQSVQLLSVETNTMELKIDMFLTKASFGFLKLCFICPQLNWQNDNFCVFNRVLPRSEKCPPNPKYWVFLSEFSWKWYVLLFSKLLYNYFFQFGFRKFLLCKNTTWLSCIYEISTYINKNASQPLLLIVYRKWFWKLDG